VNLPPNILRIGAIGGRSVEKEKHCNKCSQDLRRTSQPAQVGRRLALGTVLMKSSGRNVEHGSTVLPGGRQERPGPAGFVYRAAHIAGIEP